MGTFHTSRRRGAAWLFTVRLALSSVRMHPLRSFLSALAVSVGVAGLVAVNAVVGGLDRAFASKMPLNRAGTVYLTHQPRQDALDGTWRPPPPRIVPVEAEFLRERVTSASAIIPYYATILNRETEVRVMVSDYVAPEVEVFGVPENWPLLGQHPIRGRFFSTAEVTSHRAVALVGVDVAAMMEERGLGLGSAIMLAGQPLEVVGVLNPLGLSLWGTSLDATVVVPVGVYEDILGETTSLTVGVIAARPEEAAKTQDEVIGAMRAVRKLPPGQPNNFNADPAAEGRELYQKLSIALNVVGAALALLSLLISGGGILNIMLLSVTERTREIGLRSALGVRPRMVIAQFLLEGAAISSAGGLGGLLLGSGIAWAVATLTPLPARVTPLGLLIGLAFGLFVGTLFAFLPALRASRLLPAEALRS